MSRDAKGDPTQQEAVPSVGLRDRAPIGLRVQGRYRIVSELGTGAFGPVYLAEDGATGHEVAIRLLPRGLVGVPPWAQAGQRTGSFIVAASTAHPALVHVLEFGEAEDGQAFVTMERVEGRRLSEMLSEGRLEVGTALRLAGDLGGAVEALHNVGLVHGALRPRNVMVGADGRIKLMDVELTGLPNVQAMKSIIKPEPPPEYLSPEQIRQSRLTENADTYAFAVILYEMLCGVPPFQGDTRESVLAKHLTETPVPMRRRRRAVPSSVESIVAQALSKRPELRPPIQTVVNCVWQEAAFPASRWKRSAAIVGGSVLAASIVALVAWSLLAPRPPAPSPLARPAPPPAAAPAPAPAPAAVPAPVSEISSSSVPTTKPRPRPTLGTAGTAVAPRATTPASGSARAERREQSRVPQASADFARERPAVSSDADDPDVGAVVDWMLERAAAGRK